MRRTTWARLGAMANSPIYNSIYMSFVKKAPLTKAQKQQKLQESLNEDISKAGQEEEKTDGDQKRTNVFFGHPHLDGIFENRLRTGTLMVMEEDSPSKFSNYL